MPLLRSTALSCTLYEDALEVVIKSVNFVILSLFKKINYSLSLLLHPIWANEIDVLKECVNCYASSCCVSGLHRISHQNGLCLWRKRSWPLCGFLPTKSPTEVSLIDSAWIKAPFTELWWRCAVFWLHCVVSPMFRNCMVHENSQLSVWLVFASWT